MRKNKKILLIFVLLFVFICSFAFTLINATIVDFYEPITPNGTIIPYQIIDNEMDNVEKEKYLEDEQKYIKKGAIRLDKPTNKYNSHSYAWYNQNYEINNCVISNENAMKYFQDGSYVESNGNVGDIICYWRIKLIYNDFTKAKLEDEQVYLSNSGIIKSINGEFNPNDLDTLKNITIVSKWGKGGLFEHIGNNTPYYKDSIHDSNSAMDTLHFEHVSNSCIDDALFYITVYSPKVDAIQTIQFTDNAYIFEKTVLNRDYAMYKLNILNSGNFDFITETNGLTDIKIYNNSMNLIYDNEEIISSTESLINASLDDGVYYLRVSFKNSNLYGNIKTIVKRITSDINSEEGILIDSMYSGSEVFLNGGIEGINTITEGFTRYLFLNPNIAPSTSRLDYIWYSSDTSKAMVTQYGTLLAKKGTGNPQVTVTAVYKADKTIAFTKTFTILAENKTYENAPINVYMTMTVQRGKASLITLPNDVPYNYNQYYDWKSNTNGVYVSNYGTITANINGTATIIGTYTYNKRVKIIITLIVE